MEFCADECKRARRTARRRAPSPTPRVTSTEPAATVVPAVPGTSREAEAHTRLFSTQIFWRVFRRYSGGYRVPFSTQICPRRPPRGWPRRTPRVWSRRTRRAWCTRAREASSGTRRPSSHPPLPPPKIHRRIRKRLSVASVLSRGARGGHWALHHGVSTPLCGSGYGVLRVC